MSNQYEVEVIVYDMASGGKIFARCDIILSATSVSEAIIMAINIVPNGSIVAVIDLGHARNRLSTYRNGDLDEE